MLIDQHPKREKTDLNRKVKKMFSFQRDRFQQVFYKFAPTKKTNTVAISLKTQYANISF